MQPKAALLGAAVALAALLVRGASASGRMPLPQPLLDLQDLPPPMQHENRILAVITAYALKRTPLSQKVLHAYSEICEMGYEVHIVFVTFELWREERDSPFRPWSLYHCKRLEQNLPVAVSLHHRNDVRLAARHRELFTAFSNSYDYFISQEEDIAIRPSHIAYFTRWLRHFQGHNSSVPIIPAFTLYEVISGEPRDVPSPLPARPPLPQIQVTVATGTHPTTATYPPSPAPPPPPSPPPPSRTLHHPMVLVHKNHDPMEVFSINNVTVVLPWKTYPAMYIIPQSILKQAIARPSWTQDVYQPWREFNVYFQHHWLSHHVRMAIPLVAFRQSLIHHGSDRYTPDTIEGTGKFSDGDSHGGALEVSELQTFLARCSNTSLSSQRHTRVLNPRVQHARIQYVTNDARIPSDARAPCAVCVGQGLGARFLLRAWGPSPIVVIPPERGRTPPFIRMTADIECISSISQQMTEPCETAGRCGPGEMGA